MPRKKRPTKRKGFSVWLLRGKWYVGFSVAGRRYQRPLGCPPETPRGEVERIAAGEVAGLRSDYEETATAKASNAIEEHAASIKHRSSGHRENCARYAAHLRERFGARVNVCSLEPEDIETWLHWLLNICESKGKGRRGKHLSKKSAAEHLAWLYAVRKKAGLPPPERIVRPPRKTHDEAARAIKYFTTDEIQALIEESRSEYLRSHNHRFDNALIFLTFTGCRAGEMQGITPGDMDRGNQIVYVTGKGRRRRGLRLKGPMQPAWDALLAEIKRRGPERETVFPAYAGWPRKSVDRLAQAVLGKRGFAHMLRHSFASMALQSFDPPWDMGYLAKWLGHVDVSVTYRIYAHWQAPEPQSGPKFVL